MHNALSLWLWPGACSGRRSRAGGVCSPPDMWVFKQGASRPALSLGVHVESNASRAMCSAAGWLIVGWVRVCTRVWFY